MLAAGFSPLATAFPWPHYLPDEGCMVVIQHKTNSNQLPLLEVRLDEVLWRNYGRITSIHID